MKIKNRCIFLLGLILSLSISGCASTEGGDTQNIVGDIIADVITDYLSQKISEYSTDELDELESVENTVNVGIQYAKFDLKNIPEYNGESYVEVNNNTPFFTEREINSVYIDNFPYYDEFECYSELDNLGRCRTAYANICINLMPTEERGNIGQVKPTGWHTVKYDGINGNYLYNRCHLIAFCLAGENANPNNLITGTRYLNIEGMLPFEIKVADYVEKTKNHVLYRVTPVYEDENLIASGVLIEAYSLEDEGEGIRFCVYCYNVQPGITINYLTGDSSGPEYKGEK